MRKTVLFGLIVFISILFLIGCVSKSNELNEVGRSISENDNIKDKKFKKEIGGTEFLLFDDNSVVYFNWSKTEEVIKGQMTYTKILENDKLNIDSQTSPFTGHIIGDDLSIQFDNEKQMVGNYYGDHITLKNVDEKGFINEMKLNEGDIDDYNERVLYLNQKVDDLDSSNEQIKNETEEIQSLMYALVELQEKSNGFKTSSTNPKKLFPTWDCSKGGSKDDLNQPNEKYVAQIDLNACDNNGYSFGYSSEGLSIPASFQWFGPNDTLSAYYFGVLKNGKVFATKVPPSKEPNDSEKTLNRGNTGNGGWLDLNTSITYMVDSDGPLSDGTLKELDF